MKINNILIVLGEPQSIFQKYYLNILVQKNFQKIKKNNLIGSIKILETNKKLKFSFNLKAIKTINEAKLKK